MTEVELEKFRCEAIDGLAKSGDKLRFRLSCGDTHVRNWEECARGIRTKVGRGWLIIWTNYQGFTPGVTYSSSQGANSDDSYGGFLPHVNLDEAKLLIYGDFLRQRGAYRELMYRDNQGAYHKSNNMSEAEWKARQMEILK